MKKLIVKYRKTIIKVGISSFIPITLIYRLIVHHKITSIKNNYLKQPEALIDEFLNESLNKLVSEAMPSIIMSSILISLLIFIVIFTIGLITHFRHRHNIYLIYELKLYLKEKKASKK